MCTMRKKNVNSCWNTSASGMWDRSATKRRERFYILVCLTIYELNVFMLKKKEKLIKKLKKTFQREMNGVGGCLPTSLECHGFRMRTFALFGIREIKPFFFLGINIGPEGSVSSLPWRPSFAGRKSISQFPPPQ